MELHPGVPGYRRDCEGAAVVESPSCTWGLGLRSGVRSQIAAYWASWADSLPRVRERHPRSPFDADFQRQQSSGCSKQFEGNDLWMLDSMPQSGVTFPKGRDQADPQGIGTPQNHVSDNVRPALTSRGHFSRMSSGPSFHRPIEPSSDPNVVICWHPLHLFTSGGRVALGTSDLPGSAPSSSLVPLPLSALLPVRPSP